MAKGETNSWRVAEGEEARLTPEGPTAAEIRSRGFLPLRVRTEGAYRLRPPFPGTAIAVGEPTFEVVAEESLSDDIVVYRLEPWPDDHVIRDRVVYGPRLVRAAQAERQRAAERARYRPFRFLLYPLVGLLPEAPQERLCDRLGLYSVTATIVSGFGEAVTVLALIYVSSLAGGELRGRLLALAPPALALLVLPGVGRAFGAMAFRETTGSTLVVAAWDLAEALGHRFQRHDETIVPLTRDAFWVRLCLPDRIEKEGDGSLVFRSLLPHLTWTGGRRLRAGDDYWMVTPLPPALDRARLVHGYHLIPLGESADTAGPAPPSPTAYSDEVLAQVEREWDDLMTGFAWLVSMLPTSVQKRAVERRGGHAVLRTPTIVTTLTTMGFALYVLQFLLRGPSADPVGPWLGLLALALLFDGAVRLLRAGQGQYAPSLLSFPLPCDSLRPERLAYHAHRDGERELLRGLRA